jgi:DNA-binding NarL/FixJ family response regulator
MVIMLTNYPYPQYRKKCADAGADFFFDKSTEFDKIAEVFKKFTR